MPEWTSRIQMLSRLLKSFPSLPTIRHGQLSGQPPMYFSSSSTSKLEQNRLWNMVRSHRKCSKNPSHTFMTYCSSLNKGPFFPEAFHNWNNYGSSPARRQELDFRLIILYPVIFCRILFAWAENSWTYLIETVFLVLLQYLTFSIRKCSFMHFQSLLITFLIPYRSKPVKHWMFSSSV